MAETVLSMARSMLGSAVKKAAAAAAEEMSLLMGVQKEIWFMKDELETMQAFLVAPEVTNKKDKLVKVWAKQVRDLSYDIEDCLDEFTVHVGSQSLSQQMRKLKDRHRIAVQIRNLKARVVEVSKRNTRYNLIKTEASSSMDKTESYLEDIRNHSATNIDEAQLVGFDRPKKNLLDMIQVCADDGQRRVIFVVGMGGLGKTTLARKIYESKEDVLKKFSCRAWITVSQSFSKTELLQSMIRKLLDEESLKECKDHTVNGLATCLNKGLQLKSYFIVLDDLWTSEAWNWINEIAFPSTNNNGSLIIVTTRNAEIANGCSSTESLVYNLEPLQLNDAIELLLRKAWNKAHEDMDENLKGTVKELVQKCGRLPLPILTVGGILASKKIEEWGTFCSQLPSELENNQSLKSVRRIVTLSYSNLPSHLKPCFLYLSIFPEDIEIERRRLVERWIAEGLVTAKVGMTAEEVGERYFQELIDRSMILPARVNIEGVVKSCRVHDIVRDTIVYISREENFVYSIEDNVPGVVVGEKFRHVAYHGKSCISVGVDWSCVRSLTTFGKRPLKPATSLCSPELRMLRTLDLKDAQFRIAQKDMNNIGLLRHLKYVNVQYVGTRFDCGHSNIYALPSSIGKLQSLQVLDLRGSCISSLPTEVTKLQSLQSLRCSMYDINYWFDLENPLDCMLNVLCLPIVFTPLVDSERRPRIIAEAHMAFSCSFSIARAPGVRVPRGMGNLRALQILELVDLNCTNTKAIEELGELSQLRKLRVLTRGASKGKCKAFRKALVKLTSLRSLLVDSGEYYGTTLEWLGSSDLSPPPQLRSLKLIGKIGTTPDWFGNLTRLVKMYLQCSRLKDLEILGALPNLMLLHLSDYAYSGEKLTFKTGAFPRLKKLVISKARELTVMRFEKGTSPCLESIQIVSSRLKSGIIAIKHLPRLKEISLGYNCNVAGLDMLQGEVDQHPNKPVLRLEEDRSEHDLGDVVGSGVEEEAADPEFFDADESFQVITTTDDSEIHPVPS